MEPTFAQVRLRLAVTEAGDDDDLIVRDGDATRFQSARALALMLYVFVEQLEFGALFADLDAHDVAH